MKPGKNQTNSITVEVEEDSGPTPALVRIQSEGIWIESRKNSIGLTYPQLEKILDQLGEVSLPPS